MAKDIELDFLNGKMLNRTVDGKKKILQQLKIATRIFKGHWEWDSNYGTDMINSGNDSSVIRQNERDMIEQVEGVIAVKSINITENFDNKGTGTFAIDAIIQLDNETITLEGERVY